jgi:hypothetical protein
VIPPLAGVSSARLFRLLLQRPRATAPIDYRIRGAEDVPLRVRALSSIDEAEIGDSDGPSDQRMARAATEIIHRSLLTPQGLAFASPDEVGALMSTEAAELARACRLALDTISPTYTRHDVEALNRKLIEGGKADGNWPTALALGGCVDVSYGYGIARTSERPDRYFGVPLAELTDGQWMVFRASRKILEELTNK